MRRKNKLKRIDGVQIASIIILTFSVLLVIVPFWTALVISFETPAAHATNPFSLWPVKVTLDNYKTIFKDGGRMLRAYASTIFITTVGTVFGMTVSTMGAYALSRRFPGKRFFMVMLLVTMFFSGGLVPTYLMMKNLNLLNTFAGVILIGLVSVWNILIIKNGFESIPRDLQDAAMIDGAQDLQIFAKIMLPLQKPTIVTFSLFTAVNYWNSWYWPMLLLNDPEKKTLQLLLRNIIDTANQINLNTAAEETFSAGIKMASVFAVMLPIMTLYPFLQKYFVKGVMVGAVKM